MRRHLSLLLVACGLAPVAALAENYAISAPIYSETRERLVGLALSSSQALVWDSVAGEYVLLRQGGSLASGRINSILRDRIVVDRPMGRLVFELETPTTANTVVQSIVPPTHATSPAVHGTQTAMPAVAPTAPVSTPAPAATPPPFGDAAAASPYPGMAQDPAPVSTSLATPAPSPFSGSGPSAVASPPPAFGETEKRIDGQVFRQQLEDFNAIASFVTVTPVEGGGYRLTLVKRGGYLERLGLRDGDVVKKIDGRAINSADDASRAYSWLRATDHFSVDVVREGVLVTLRYRLVG